jgi:hypothetical protein
VTSVDRRKSKTERPLDGLSELPLALIGGRCAPPNLPTETKARTFLMKVGVGLAVVAVHMLSWPYQQQHRNTPSRPSNEAGQGSRPSNAPEAPYASPSRFQNQVQPQVVALGDIFYHHPFCWVENQAGFELFPDIKYEVRRRSVRSPQLPIHSSIERESCFPPIL